MTLIFFILLMLIPILHQGQVKQGSTKGLLVFLIIGQVAKSHSLQKDLVAPSRATSWSDDGVEQRIRPTSAESEPTACFSPLKFPSQVQCTLAIRGEACPVIL